MVGAGIAAAIVLGVLSGPSCAQRLRTAEGLWWVDDKEPKFGIVRQKDDVTPHFLLGACEGPRWDGTPVSAQLIFQDVDRGLYADAVRNGAYIVFRSGPDQMSEDLLVEAIQLDEMGQRVWSPVVHVRSSEVLLRWAQAPRLEITLGIVVPAISRRGKDTSYRTKTARWH
jgi:hypothetical protein